MEGISGRHQKDDARLSHRRKIGAFDRWSCYASTRFESGKFVFAFFFFAPSTTKGRRLTSFEKALEAAEAGADIVMLDNFVGEQLKKDAATIKGRYPHLIIEASGGITTETMPEYLCEHVDVVSQGKLTQGYSCIDYSLKIVPPS